MGKTVGIEFVGIWDGDIVGTPVGALLVMEVGTCVGDTDGYIVGTQDGDSVGTTVGALVVMLVGTCVGDTDGYIVGWTVGVELVGI